ncbi:MAG: InlB B-repeat-containing protein [Eubacteriales bacterium]|nr:InlB B-repeat-containing protein [Eubacteriales bacterium]
MKKRILGLFLCLVMCLSLMPMSAFATETVSYDLWVNEEQFTSDKTSIACGSGTATFDVDTNTLTLVNATIDKYIQDGWDYYSIRSKLPNLTIDLVGYNTIDGKNMADGINAAGGCNVIIKGSGTLTINNAYYGIYIGYYDTPGGDLKIENTTVTVNESYAAGIWGNHDINFVNSDVTINRTRADGYSGIVSNKDGTITVNGGLIKVDNKKQAILLGNGDSSAHKLIVNSGKLELTSTGSYGIYSQPVIGPEGEETNAVNGKIEINGGIVDITSNSGGTNIPESDITLSNGMEYYEENTNFSSTGNILIKKIYTLTFNLNGGTPKTGLESVIANKTVDDGDEMNLDSTLSLVVNAPDGKVLDALEINGTRYELDGSTYTIHSDATIKFLWKDAYKIILDINGGTPDDPTMDLEETIPSIVTITNPYVLKLNDTNLGKVNAPDGKEFSHYEIEGTEYAVGDEYTINNTKSVTIKWVWTENTTPPATTYTVTFNMNGHGTQVAAQTVEDGNKATKPADPTASGWTFDGWYADATFSAAFDFDTTIAADTTIYAKWTKNTTPPTTTYTVSFNMNGHGDQIAAQTVEEGYKATKPADPTAEGWTFSGWYADSTFNVAFDFDATINANTTVYAKWTEVKTDNPTDPTNPTNPTDSTNPTNPTNPTKPADPTSPQTGDNSHMFLWIALLFISGGVLVGTTLYGRKKKYNAD